MRAPPQSPLRFVPTLTEIVRPSDFAATHALEQQQLTDRLIQRIMPKVETQLRASLQALVQDQLRILEPQLQQALELAAREAIARAVCDELNVPVYNPDTAAAERIDAYQ